jgi:hypothetical protein
MAESVLDRSATRLLEALGRKLWGFTPRLMREIVGRLGGLGALGWFVANMPRYERTLKVLGPLRTHLLCLEISLRNGCPYCTYGHAYAFELHYLRERDRRFPLDEHEIVGLHRLEPALLAQRLAEALQAAALAGEIPLFHRLLALADGQAGEPEEHDRRLRHLLRMFAVLNTCAIESNVAPDEAHDPINKDRALRERYAALRREAAGRADATS